MKFSKTFQTIANVLSVLIMLFAFFLFYSDTNKFLQSLVAAFLLFAIVWGSFVVIKWVIESLPMNKQ